VSKQRHYPALRLTVIHALERTAPAGRPGIEWKLITDLLRLDRQVGRQLDI
jgi:hypothetical protein